MNAERSSGTAKLIAAATVMCEACRGRGSAAPPGAAAWCERFLSTSLGDRLLLWSVKSALGRAWWRFAESIGTPGVVAHWMRRKREIDQLARQAAAEGFTQLVVLGAGLDTLAFRLAQERVYDRIFTADHPATLAVVRSALRPSESPVASPPTGASVHNLDHRNVELLPMDFACDDVRAVLTASPVFESSLDTMVVIEGVLMYLSESTVEHVLRSVAGLPTRRLRLVASWMLAEPGQPIGFHGQSRLVGAWLRRRQEPMRWASTPSDLPVLLARLGWDHARLIDLSTNDDRSCADARGLRSELLVVAE